jgi:hypothetical protein
MKRIFIFESKLSIPKKSFTFSFIFLFFLSVSNICNSQVLITLFKETFPNKNNEILSSPVNQSFSECTGNWTGYSTTSKATVGCFEAPYSPVTNAIKMVQLSTSGVSAADAYATSPVTNLGNPGCNGKYDFSFNLYTYNCVAGDNNAYLAIDFSKDGGTTWNTVWQMTSGTIYSNYGINAVANIWLAFPSVYFTSNFRYRFHSHMNANNPNTFYTFIDEPTIYAYSCSDAMNLGNLVWLDLNQNGLKDASEQGLAGVPLELTRDNDLDGYNDWDFTPLTTVTDINGNYSFSNLTAGRYKVTLAGITNTYRLVSINAGEPDEDGDNNNNGLLQSTNYTTVNGGWITLLPQSEPTNDGDGNNGNQTYDFAIYPAAPLPVKSVTLNLNYFSGTTNINWTTVNEVNVALFEVERSADNKNFEKVAFKIPQAAYNGDASYNITDVTGNNFTTVIYYRIKIVDKDGKYSYSNIAAVKVNTRNAVSVWPNPFVNEIKVTYTAKGEEKVLIKITDNTGKLLKTQTFNCTAGNNKLSITGLTNLINGIYTVIVNSGSGASRTVFTIIK